MEATKAKLEPTLPDVGSRMAPADSGGGTMHTANFEPSIGATSTF